MEKVRVKRWYRTLEISAHCLCEQGYDASRLIEIAKYIERVSGVKANPVADEIQKTIDFHVEWERQEKGEKSLKERESRLIKKHEKEFRRLPGLVMQQMIHENGESYWKAVEVYTKKGKRYAGTITNKIKQKESERW